MACAKVVYEMRKQRASLDENPTAAAVQAELAEFHRDEGTDSGLNAEPRAGCSEEVPTEQCSAVCT